MIFELRQEILIFLMQVMVCLVSTRKRIKNAFQQYKIGAFSLENTENITKI